MINYNLHPIFVHFPVALLFIYSIIKILPLRKWLPRVSWSHIERALLFFGVLGAFAALATGDIAEHLVQPNHKLVEMHSTFAVTATWIYCILLLGEIISVLNTSYQSLVKSEQIKNFLLKVEKVLCQRILAKILALLGFVAITVTGLLGGVMVYGTSADPLAGIVLKLLGISL